MKMSLEQNNRLFYAAKSGDGEAFTELYKQYWDMAYYNCLTRQKHKQDAEDATQEVFIILHRRISKLERPELLARAIKYIAAEVCGNHGKKVKGIPKDWLVSLEEAPDTLFADKDEFLPHIVAERDELKQQVLKYVKTLPKKQEEVIFMRYFGELSPREIAHLTRTGEQSVYNKLNIARNTLRQLIEAEIAKGEISMSAVPPIIPILTQIYGQDARAQITPELCDKILQGIKRQLAVRQIAVGQTADTKPQKPGKQTDTLLKLLIGGSAAVAVTCAVIAGVNYFQSDTPAEAPGQPEAYTTQVAGRDILAELESISTRGDLERFARDWEFTEINQVLIDGDTYTVYHKEVGGVRIFAGGVETAQGVFTPAWGQVSVDSQVPEGVEIKQWTRTIDN